MAKKTKTRSKTMSKTRSKISRRNKTRRRRHQKKVKGGSMVVPLRSVIPFNNYDNGDPQREMESARNIP